jgi:hypothetical protein
VSASLLQHNGHVNLPIYNAFTKFTNISSLFTCFMVRIQSSHQFLHFC